MFKENGLKFLTMLLPKTLVKLVIGYSDDDTFFHRFCTLVTQMQTFEIGHSGVVVRFSDYLLGMQEFDLSRVFVAYTCC